MHYNESIIQIFPAVARMGHVNYKDIGFVLMLLRPLYFQQPANNREHHIIMWYVYKISDGMPLLEIIALLGYLKSNWNRRLQK